MKVDEKVLNTEQNLVSMMAGKMVLHLDEQWGDKSAVAMAMHLDDSRVEMKEE